MFLTTKSRYAVAALITLAKNSRASPLSLAQIAALHSIDAPYLEQIMSKLRKANLVATVRGPGGGYVLAKASSEISIYDIVSASDEKIAATSCKNSPAGCQGSNTQCASHHLWHNLELVIQNYLQAITLKSVSDGKERRPNYLQKIEAFFKDAHASSTRSMSDIAVRSI